MPDVEQALRQIATHRCRRDSSLKLNPRHCRERIRRAMAPTPISTMLDFRTSVFLHCKGCPGPVPFAGEDSSPPDPIRLVSEATARKEGRVEEAPQRRLCSRNGKGCPVDGPQPLENFPGDRKTKSGHKSYCKTCQTIYQKARRARQRSKKAGRSEEPSRQEAAPTGAIVESPIQEAVGPPVSATSENLHRWPRNHPTEDNVSNEEIFLDFSRDDRDLKTLERITESARINRRTLEKEILHLLERMTVMIGRRESVGEWIDGTGRWWTPISTCGLANMQQDGQTEEGALLKETEQ